VASRRPIQWLWGQYRAIPWPIRLLTLGTFVNRLGGFFATFLALILAVRGFSAWQISLALALVGVAGIAGAVAGGVAAARVGNRWTIVVSTAGAALFTALLALRSSYPLTVAIACCISLLNRAYTAPSAAVVGELASPSLRVPLFAFYRLAINVGAAVGALLAGFLLTRSVAALLLVDAATSACFALAALRLPRDRPIHELDPKLVPLARVRGSVLRDRRYLVLCVALGLVAIVYSQQAGVLPLSMKAHGYSFELFGALLSANAVAVILLELPLATVIRRWAAWAPLAAGAALICGGYAFYGIDLSLPILLTGVAVWTSGEMLLSPVAPAAAVMMSSPRSHSSYQAALAVAQTAGQTIGPALGVLAYSINPELPWWGCGVAGLFAVGAIMASLKTRESEGRDFGRLPTNTA
jgi:predicted MFS family arabinose efflux permease